MKQHAASSQRLVGIRRWRQLVLVGVGLVPLTVVLMSCGSEGSPSPAAAASPARQAALVDEAAPVAVAHQFLDAVNRGDADGAMVYVADDAKLGCLNCSESGCNGSASCIGPEMIRQNFVGPLIANHAKFTVIKEDIAGDTVSWRVEQRGDGISSRGYDRIVSLVDVTVKGARISWVTTRIDLFDQDTNNFYHHR